MITQRLNGMNSTGVVVIAHRYLHTLDLVGPVFGGISVFSVVFIIYYLGLRAPPRGELSELF